MSSRLPRMRGGLLDRAFDAAAAGGAEVLGKLPRIGQHQVPGVVPRGAAGPGGRGSSPLGRVQQGVDRVRSASRARSDCRRSGRRAPRRRRPAPPGWVRPRPRGSSAAFTRRVDHHQVVARRATAGRSPARRSCRGRRRPGRAARSRPRRRASAAATSFSPSEVMPQRSSQSGRDSAKG